MLQQRADQRRQDDADIAEMRTLLAEYGGLDYDEAAMEAFSKALQEETGALPPPRVVVNVIKESKTADPRIIGNGVRAYYRRARARSTAPRPATGPPPARVGVPQLSQPPAEGAPDNADTTSAAGTEFNNAAATDSVDAFSAAISTPLAHPEPDTEVVGADTGAGSTAEPTSSAAAETTGATNLVLARGENGGTTRVGNPLSSHDLDSAGDGKPESPTSPAVESNPALPAVAASV